MPNQVVPKPEQLPAKEEDRQITDCICVIFGAAFAIGMFVFAYLLWNKDKFVKLYNPITQAGYVPCTLNQYMSLKDPSDFESRECVKICPSGYEGIAQGICLPQDPSLRQKYLANKKFTRPLDNAGFIQTLFFVFVLSIGYGLLRMTVTHCWPRYVPIFSYFLAALILLGLAGVNFSTTIVSSRIGFFSYAFGGLLILLALILIIMLCMYSNEAKFQGYMLEYAVKFLDQNPHTFVYIPVFILLHIAFVVLILWQHGSFASHYFTSPNFWKFSTGQILDVLTAVEYIWGLQFLRDAYNYCISGNAVQWYWTSKSSCCKPIQRLICKNWGSVVGGSFFNAFFQVPTLISELFVCHPGTCCSGLGICCYNYCSFFTFFFQTVRTDAYSYITLTGTSFCDAARKCSKLCQKSKQFVGFHSAMKHHRLVSHIASISFIFFWAFWILVLRTANYDMWNLAVLVFVIYGTVTWFIGIHVDAAEGLQTSYLAELELEGEHQYMHRLLPSIRKILQPHQNRIQGDGNC